MILKIREHQPEEREAPVELVLEKCSAGIRLCAFKGVEGRHIATVCENGFLFLPTRGVNNDLREFGFRTKPNGEIETV